MFDFHLIKKLFVRRDDDFLCETRLRRIADTTIPNKLSENECLRFKNRNNRTIPVLFCPTENGSLDLPKATIAVTKDICDRGVSIILSHPVAADEVVVGFNLPGDVMNEPWFFQGILRRIDSIGGGYWLLAVELFECLNRQGQKGMEHLISMSQKLLPIKRRTDEFLEPDRGQLM